MLTTYSVQLLSPFSNLWFHADGLFIIDVWLWLLLADRHRRVEAARAARQGVAAASAGGDRDHPRLHRHQPAHYRSGQCGGARLGGRSRGEVDLRVAAAGRLLAARSRLARGRLLPAQPATIRSRGGFGTVTECQPANMEDPIVREAIRRDPKLQKFLKWSILPQAEVDARGLLGADRDRRRALRPGPPVAARARDRHRRPADRDAAKPRQLRSQFITEPS